MGDKFGGRGKNNVVVAGPIFEEREIGRDDDEGKFALVADDGAGADQGIQL